MSFHDLLDVNAVHIPYNWTFPNAAAREALSVQIDGRPLTAEEVGKFAKQEDDNSIWMLTSLAPTWTFIGGGSSASGYKAESLTYTDTANLIIGPLTLSPTEADEVNMFVFTGPLQEYTLDYTVREVTGGSAPGFYICVSPLSTAPGGGSFTVGSNPGTGISSVLSSGDKVRVTYPV